MYKVVLTRKAQKAYQQADTSLVLKLNRCFETISLNPYRHPNIKSLKGQLKGRWRYRVGSYRVVYRIDEVNKKVTVLLIASRGEVYQQ